MVSGELRDSIILLFRARDFENMWFIITGWYEHLGFTDVISDQDRIDEYKWITQQIRKYMFSKQDYILSSESLDQMLAKIEDLISKADEYGDDRKHVVYNFMRDHWLQELRFSLGGMIEDLLEYEDDEESE